MAQGLFTTGVLVAGGQLLGSELLPMDGVESECATAQQLAAAMPHARYGSNGSVSSFTATAVEVTGGALTVLALTGVLTIGETMSMPGVAQMAAAYPGAFSGLSYVLRVMNQSTGAFTWTVAGNAGVTVSGVAVISNGTWREYLVTFGTGLASATMQSIGGGTAI